MIEPLYQPYSSTSARRSDTISEKSSILDDDDDDTDVPTILRKRVF